MRKYKVIRQKSSPIIDEEIRNLDLNLVWTWIKNGNWNKKDFERWLEVMRVIENGK